MKTINLRIAIALILSIVVAFASCKKNDPIPEDDQEEFDNVKIVFTNLDDPSDVSTINFDKAGKPDKSHFHLLKSEKYKMELTLFHNGENINHEFIDEIDEHKFFFLAPADAVANYVYQDNDLGLTGEITFGNVDTAFELTILMRHGLDKSHPSAKAWNSSDYQKAGGVDDLKIILPIHLVTSDDADH